ncbi:MAG: hypothetical protein HY900_05465 [Deltaproteobacteria bacterium]|nr:hypothetical protein [Deltaproteobacteria bacterium]
MRVALVLLSACFMLLTAEYANAETRSRSIDVIYTGDVRGTLGICG